MILTDILLNTGWGYYNYPSLVELLIVILSTLFIEELIISLYCHWHKLNIKDSVGLMFIIVFANMVTGVIGYLMAFSGIG